jgi:hypothetical protein
MTVNPARTTQQPADEARPTMVEMIERLSRFDGPPEQFLVNLLAVQCHLAAASGGAILRINPSQQVEILAVYPQPAPGSTAPVWLAQSAESGAEVISGGKTAVKPLHTAGDLYGQPASQHLVMLPLRGGSGVLGLATFLVASNDTRVLAAAQQRLELTVSLLSLYEMRLTLQQRQGDLRRLRLAMETTAAVNEQRRFKGAAMALCNEVASRWGCDRVGLGFLKGRYVHLKALSHTEKFSRKMKLVQDIESAMEETLDQDVEVLYPTPRDATFVSRATGELAKRHGPSAVLNMPLRWDDDVAAVLCLERSADEVFAIDEIESLRLACDLATPRLINMHEHDRWVGARAAGAIRTGLAALVGPKHTWIKVAGIAICAAILFVVFARGEFRAEASFVLESTRQQVVPAAFDGYLRRAYVKSGDVVIGSAAQPPSWALTEESIADWYGLLEAIRAEADAQTPSPGRGIWAGLSSSTRELIAASLQGAAPAPGRRDAEPDANRTPVTDPNGGAAQLDLLDKPDAKTRKNVLDELNALLAEKTFYNKESWPDLKPSPRQEHLLKALNKKVLKGTRLVELNRSLLLSAYPGKVNPGPTVLAELETAELRLELQAAEAERLGYLKQGEAAMRPAEEKRAEAQIAQARAKQVLARIRLFEHNIEQAVLVSPIDGYVVSGDLERQLGAPVKKGDVLFEIASLAHLRAELSVPEDLIADVQSAFQRTRSQDGELTGELATTARPRERIAFTVTRITPVAVGEEQKNVFKVRAALTEAHEFLRPGMEGVAKIDIEKRSYGFIWTRKLVNWVRMKLWL